MGKPKLDEPNVMAMVLLMLFAFALGWGLSAYEMSLVSELKCTIEVPDIEERFLR